MTEARRIESLIARQIDGLLVVAARDEFGSTPGFPTRLPPTVLVDRARAMQISIRSVRTISTRPIAAPAIFLNSATRT